jgi:hypothetical protein
MFDPVPCRCLVDTKDGGLREEDSKDQQPQPFSTTASGQNPDMTKQVRYNKKAGTLSGLFDTQ